MVPIDEQTFLLGFARVSTVVDAAVLGQLALAGQRRRFERPAVSRSPQRLAIADESRPILPEEARRLFMRLFADAPKSPGDRLEEAAVAALDGADLRLHPFDFAELEPFVLRHRKRLGAAAASWAAMARPRSADEEDQDNGALAQLRRMRESDPDRARSDIEAAFPGYPAATRLAILDALAVGLGEDDVGFLSSLEGDKARTVRERAVTLLGNIPGTPAYATRLARACDHLKVRTSGLVFKKKSLVVLGITEKSGSLWQLLAGLHIEDLAEALGLDGRALVELAAETDGLDEVMLHAVLTERRYGLARLFDKRMRDDGADWILMLARLLPAASAEDREELLKICVNPAQWAKLPNDLPTLHEIWGGALPLPIARRLLSSDAWKRFVDTAATGSPAQSSGIPEAVAALLPAALSRDFIPEVEPLSPRAADFHRFLLALAEEAI